MSDCNFEDPRIDDGIRLFNAGEFFACHDVLEDFWGEQTCAEKPFFQGLIQAAVALFHFEDPSGTTEIPWNPASRKWGPREGHGKKWKEDAG